MAGKEHVSVGYFIFATLMLIVLCMLLMPGKTVDSLSAVEARHIEANYGRTTLERVNAFTADMYYALMPAQTASNLRESFKPTDAEREELSKYDLADKAMSWWEGRVDVLLDLMWWTLRRVAFLLLFTPFWGVFAVASLIHGYWSREIKKTGFEYASPVINHLSRQAGGFAFLSAIVLVFLPFPLEPLILFSLLAFSLGCLGLAVANIQKQI